MVENILFRFNPGTEQDLIKVCILIDYSPPSPWHPDG